MTTKRDSTAAPTWVVWLALWTVYLIWGSTYLAIRITVETLPPLTAGGVRFLLAGALMYGWLAVRRGRAGVRVTRRQVGASAIVGGALLLGGNGLVMLAELEVPSGLAALIIASVPLWVVVLRSVFGDVVRGGTLVGVAAGFVGVGLLVLPSDKPGGASFLGLLTLVLASLFWASGSYYSKRAPLPGDPFTSTAVQMLAGGAILMVAGLARGELAGLDVSAFSAASLGALGYLVVAGSLLAFTAYTWLLQNAPISKVATYAYVNPVVAIFLGWLILAEPITPIVVVAASIIVSSVAFIVRKESVPAPAGEAESPTAPAGALALEAEGTRS